MLSSVKTSKKLEISNIELGSCRTLVFPVEALVGLSRIITPAGSVPPEASSESISVSNVLVLPSVNLPVAVN
jgi:hypothetical protein